MHEYKAKIRRIVDGDTVDVDIDLGFDMILSKQRIRLYGIDTPESRTRDKEEKFYGKLASAFLKDQCKKGSCIALRTHLDKRGKFGRILGEIIVDGVNVNQLMIEEHMAVKYHGQSKVDIHKEHMFNRQELNRTGIKYS
jgi:micrococcal nuclease